MKMINFIVVLSIVVFPNILMSQKAEWVKRIKGADNDVVYTMDIDKENNIYIGGVFDSPTLIFNEKVSLKRKGLNDAYIAKFNSEGDCQWAVNIGGSNNDNCNSIAVDKYGDIFVIGTSASKEIFFNNEISITHNAQAIPYIAKFDKDGVCLWANQIAEAKDCSAHRVAVDSSGNVCVIGVFMGNYLKFNDKIGLYGGNSIVGYVAKYNTDGELRWASRIGGEHYVDMEGVAIDKNDNIYITGYFYVTGISFNNGKNLVPEKHFDNNVFIAQYDSNGACQWAEKIYGFGYPYPFNIAVDNFGNPYIIGQYNDFQLFLNNGVTLISDTYNYFFIAKYNNKGRCQWVNKIDATDALHSKLAFDKGNNLYIAGYFHSKLITFSDKVYFSLSDAQQRTAYLAKYNSDNGGLKWAELITSTPWCFVNHIVVDNNNKINLAGYYNSNVVFNNGKSFEESKNNDIFLVQYSQLATLTTKPLSNKTQNTINSGGIITANSGESITIRGVCWATHPNPTIEDYKTDNGVGMGDYNSVITGLSPDSNYYIRAFATNLYGTAYGNEYSSSPTSIDNFNTLKSTNIVIYPNPASNYINITMNNEANLLIREVQILNLLGLAVSKSELTDGNNRIDISNLPRGTYFVKVGDKVEKFVKM